MRRAVALGVVAFLAGCLSSPGGANGPSAPDAPPRQAGFRLDEAGPLAVVASYRTEPGAACRLATQWSLAGAQEGIVGLHLLELGDGPMDKYWEILASGSTVQVHAGAVDTRGPGPGLRSEANVTLQASPSGHVNSTLVALELTNAEGPLEQGLRCDAPVELASLRTGREVHLLDVDSAAGAGGSSDGVGVVAGSVQTRTFSAPNVTALSGWTMGNEGTLRIASPEQAWETPITYQQFNAVTRLEGGGGEWSFGLDVAATGFLWVAAFGTE